MRVIIAGCEYVGKTALLNKLQEWGKEIGIRFHMDDHFSLPDTMHLSEEDQQSMLALSPLLKERFQRFQAQYHIYVMQNNEHVLFAGYHIEEAVYGPLYYYDKPAHSIRSLEPQMSDDAILVLLTARPEVIQERMTEDPHAYTIIKEQDIPMLLERFREEFGQSLLRRRIQIDTSDLTPDELLQEFLTAVEPLLKTQDLVRLMMHRLDLK